MKINLLVPINIIKTFIINPKIPDEVFLASRTFPNKASYVGGGAFEQKLSFSEV